MNKLSKLALFLRSVGRSPSEFRDRVKTAVEVSWDRVRKSSPACPSISQLEAFDVLEGALARQIRPFFHEAALTRIETDVYSGQKTLKTKAPFSLKHNADIDLARFCYAMSRALEPSVILETGVAYGVTTAYLLQAIEVNQTGKLWSVDLPPLGRHAEDYVGFLVPKSLKSSWNLRRGTTRRLLPRLLPLIGQIDLFVQDSLHTYRTITDEIRTVWPFLRPGGVVIADDIGKNRAFADFAKCVNHRGCVVIHEAHKDSIFGVLVKDNLLITSPEKSDRVANIGGERKSIGEAWGQPISRLPF
jgi:predicted O-methyltransferase YrrM